MNIAEWIINFANTPSFDSLIGILGVSSASLLALIKRNAIVKFFKNDDNNSNSGNQSNNTQANINSEWIGFYKDIIASKENELSKVKEESNKRFIELQEKDIAIKNLIEQQHNLTNKIALFEVILVNQEKKLKEAILTIKALKSGNNDDTSK